MHDSLDTWSPTINLNRDPRWGRNVESPGEDPLLCGEYGKAYTQGLQNGVDPSVRQATVTLKHFQKYKQMLDTSKREATKLEMKIPEHEQVG